MTISGTIFALFVMLLAEYGSERIEIKVDNQDFVSGEVRDLMTPGIGAALSLTFGLASIVTIEYRKSVAKQDKLEKQLSSIKKDISDKDAQIQELRKHEMRSNVRFTDFRMR
ncbi:hypothetical protein IQ247_17405 [Plectonema cf. radiosum LEGE 06105]|uniref:Uncharacterized protein n=1 Tax=Plectonema cf. radiosum LEGE 06105 TaxID=945769 RepID=A0A8J7JTZ1_9CYAN|nr:hypothetical protein [Plectonema radiosum]MBE9214424.1 hypothetical protein [Plectonema cf. radiosum LEGE 06105]